MNSKDFEIDIQNIQDVERVKTQLPLNFLAFGEIENDDVKVYIKQDVYKKLEKFASSDTSKELGSILLGEYSQEHDKIHVIISEFIEAKYTDASASTLTFTHETWEYIHKEHEKLYQEHKIIGWQHTHPNYGIFLSNYDLFIQENFFNMPFQVAYVIDPIQSLRGFFQWKNGKIEKLKGYYIYDDVGKPIKIEQKRVEEPTVQAMKINKGMYTVVGLLCVLCLGLGISLVSMQKDYQMKMDAQEEAVLAINNLITEQDAIIEKQSDEIAILQERFTIETEKEEDTDDTVSFIVYTIQMGDNLSSICEKNNLDYLENKKIIMAINGIEDENKIFEGQRILLPSEEFSTP